jgi:Cdc6-like AAA superfamily ATPase
MIRKPNAEDTLLQDSDPGQIIAREKQRQQLENMVFNKIKNGEHPVPTIFIYGSSGTGKTYTVNKLREETERQIDPTKTVMMYINGRRHNTYFQILQKTWSNLEKFMPVNIDGDQISKINQGTFKASKVHDIIKEIIKQNDLTLQVTVDEIDKLSTEESKQVITTFYDMKSEDLPVQVTCISNDPYQLSKYENDIDRRISHKMHFPKYNAMQLKDILTVFADISLRPGSYTEEALSKIAGKVGQTTGSASTAKKVLYHTAGKSKEKLNPDYLDQAYEEVSKEMIKNEIISRPKHEMIVLHATAQLEKKFDRTKLQKKQYDKIRQNAPSTSNIHEKYIDICEEKNIDTRTLKTVRRMLKNLQQDDLVEGDLMSLGHGKGVSKFWEPLHDNQIILEITEEALNQ